MRQLFQDIEHLLRLAAVFLVCVLLFIAARAAFVPDDFGVYGHYRAGALDDNREHPLAFAGRAACEECHDDVVASRAGSAHEGVGCEACHGPLQAHALDPSESVPERPDGERICLTCHQASPSRPAWFPQVTVEEHSMGDACNECHEPHHPAIE